MTEQARPRVDLAKLVEDMSVPEPTDIPFAPKNNAPEADGPILAACRSAADNIANLMASHHVESEIVQKNLVQIGELEQRRQHRIAEAIRKAREATQELMELIHLQGEAAE